MSRNSRRRQRERHAAERVEREESSLSERRTEERAVRDGWLSEGHERDRIIRRMLEDFGDFATEVRHRTQIGKTLIYADLGERRLALQREALVARARADSAAEPAPTSEEPKRIIIPDVDDRLTPRTD